MVQAFNEPKYEIETSDFRCSTCQTEIPCESTYFSAVFFEPEGFRRKNYCDPCWKTGFPSLAAPPPSRKAAGASRKSAAPAAVPPAPVAPGPLEAAVFASWRARRPPLASDQPRRLRFDTDVVLEFFRRLGEEAAGSGPVPEDRVEVQFVLALLLIRKKVLNFISSINRDGMEMLKLSEKKDPGRVHWVPNPNLNDSQLEKMKDRIGELLQMQI